MTPPSHEVLLDKLADYLRMIADRNVIIILDEGKGGLTHIAQMIDLGRAQGTLMLADPKGDDYSRSQGATIVIPNREELREVVEHWKSDHELESDTVCAGYVQWLVEFTGAVSYGGLVAGITGTRDGAMTMVPRG